MTRKANGIRDARFAALERAEKAGPDGFPAGSGYGPVFEEAWLMTRTGEMVAVQGVTTRLAITDKGRAKLAAMREEDAGHEGVEHELATSTWDFATWFQQRQAARGSR